MSDRSRSYQEAIDYILQFCVGTMAHEGSPERPARGFSYHGFVATFAGDAGVRVGDLVLLTAARRSKWRLGWLVEMRDTGHRSYLIESLEDGEMCWWSNVSISYLERDAVDKRWRWTDRQWAFRDRWMKVCYKEKDAYIILPREPSFDENGYGVALGVRTRFSLDDYKPERSFDDWRKVTKAMMAQCYDQCVAESERLSQEARAARDAAKSTEEASPA